MGIQYPEAKTEPKYRHKIKAAAERSEHEAKH